MAAEKGFVPPEVAEGLPAAVPSGNGKKAPAKKVTAPKKTIAKATKKAAAPAAPKKKVAKAKAAPGERPFPRPGTLKEKAVKLYMAGKTAGDAAEKLGGKVVTFRSWWQQFKQRGIKKNGRANG